MSSSKIDRENEASKQDIEDEWDVPVISIVKEKPAQTTNSNLDEPQSKEPESIVFTLLIIAC